MEDANTQLAALKANNEADATALAALEADLTTPTTDSVGDQFLASAVSFLENQGYTVTPPTEDSGTDGEEATSTETSEDSAPTA